VEMALAELLACTTAFREKVKSWINVNSS
jgi:hypothetical protein